MEIAPTLDAKGIAPMHAVLTAIDPMNEDQMVRAAVALKDARKAGPKECEARRWGRL
jgi:hypothetical protein